MAGKLKGLQIWCKQQCDGYRDVAVTNFTSSFKSGLAFCAIIHRYRPDLINYDVLRKEDVYDNNKLAFDVANQQLGIPALLDPEDMVEMDVPDKLCIITYVAQYYNYFRDKPKVGGPGVRGSAGRRMSMKRGSVSAQSPAKRIGLTLPELDEKKPLETVPQSAIAIKVDEVGGGGTSTVDPAGTLTSNGGRRKASIMDDRCHICNNRVYLLERHMSATGRLCHRHCYRDTQRRGSMQRGGGPGSRRPSAAPTRSPMAKENSSNSSRNELLDNGDDAVPTAEQQQRLEKLFQAACARAAQETADRDENEEEAEKTPNHSRPTSDMYNGQSAMEGIREDAEEENVPTGAHRRRGDVVNPEDLSTALKAACAALKEADEMESLQTSHNRRKSSRVGLPATKTPASGFQSSGRRRSTRRFSASKQQKELAKSPAVSSPRPTNVDATGGTQPRSQFFPQKAENPPKQAPQAAVISRDAFVNSQYPATDAGKSTVAASSLISSVLSDHARRRRVRDDQTKSMFIESSAPSLFNSSAANASPVADSNFLQNRARPAASVTPMYGSSAAAINVNHATPNTRESRQEINKLTSGKSEASSTSNFASPVVSHGVVLRSVDRGDDRVEVKARPTSVIVPKHLAAHSTHPPATTHSTIVEEPVRCTDTRPPATQTITAQPAAKITLPTSTVNQPRSSALNPIDSTLSSQPKLFALREPGVSYLRSADKTQKSASHSDLSTISSTRVSSASKGGLTNASSFESPNTLTGKVKPDEKSVISVGSPSQTSPRRSTDPVPAASTAAAVPIKTPTARVNVTGERYTASAELPVIYRPRSVQNLLDSTPTAVQPDPAKSAASGRLAADTDSTKDDGKNRATSPRAADLAARREHHRTVVGLPSYGFPYHREPLKASEPIEQLTTSERKLSGGATEPSQSALSRSIAQMREQKLQFLGHTQQSTATGETRPTSTLLGTAAKPTTTFVTSARTSSDAGVQGRTALATAGSPFSPARAESGDTGRAASPRESRTSALASKWQAELDRRRSTRAAAGDLGVAQKNTRSCADLSNLSSSPMECGKTEWQLEAERRRQARGGKYVDPEKYPKSMRGASSVENLSACGVQHPSSTMKLAATVVHSGSFDDPHGPRAATAKEASKEAVEQPTAITLPESIVIKVKTTKKQHADMLKWKSVRLTASSNDVSVLGRDGNAELRIFPVETTDQLGRKDQQTTKSSETGNGNGEAGSRGIVLRVLAATEVPNSQSNNSLSAVTASNGKMVASKKIEKVDEIRKSDCGKENRDSKKLTLDVKPQQDFLRIPDADSTDSGEESCDEEDFRRLDELDAALRDLELDGRQLEERIRSETGDDDLDEHLMVEWFQLIRKRNEMVREESMLMYRRQQKELERLHEELQYQLRNLMAKPDDSKTTSDRQLEYSLMRELMETVALRSGIIENMEVDRLRYEQEDKELEDMMSATAGYRGLHSRRRSSVIGKSRKHGLQRLRKKSVMKPSEAAAPAAGEADDGSDGQKTSTGKTKKKKFFNFTFGRKSAKKIAN